MCCNMLCSLYPHHLKFCVSIYLLLQYFQLMFPKLTRQLTALSHCDPRIHSAKPKTSIQTHCNDKNGMNSPSHEEQRQQMREDSCGQRPTANRLETNAAGNHYYTRVRHQSLQTEPPITARRITMHSRKWTQYRGAFFILFITGITVILEHG